MSQRLAMIGPMTAETTPGVTVVWPRDLELRRLLTWYVVDARRVVTVAELVQWLDEVGFRAPGRTSKIVSDKLRADVARGRVRRVGRGRYVAGKVAPTTWRRIQSSARSAIRAARDSRRLTATRQAPRPGL